jgi:hypothetical protein
MESVMEKAIDKITGIYVVRPVRSTYLREYQKDHNGAIMFDRAIYSYAAERDPKTGLIVTGLTKQEAEELEIEMNLKPGSLSPYNMKEPVKGTGDFSWATFFIKIPKEGLVINADSSAKEKLYLKVLQAGSRVAKSTLDMAVNSVKYDLLLVSTEGEAKIAKDKTSLKKKAFGELSKMSINDMMDFLSVFNEGRARVTKDSTPDFIEAEIGKIVDTQPAEFLETLESEYYKTYIFLFKCVAAQLIYKQGPKFVLAAGGDLVGNSVLEAVKNLNSDDYQAIKIGLLAKLESR